MSQETATAKVADTREDRRVTRTRTLIRQALRDLIELKPFSAVSVQEIAERATVNRASFYAHFADKVFLLEDSTRTMYCAALAEHDSGSAVDPAAFLESIATATLGFVHDHRKCKLDKEFEPQIARTMQDELYKFLRSPLGESAAVVVSSAMIGAAMRWRADRYNRRPEELVEQLVAVLTSGVRLQRSDFNAVS